MQRSIYIGWDAREGDAYAVAVRSLVRHLKQPIPMHGLVLADLQDRGLYTRPTERRDGRIIDHLSIRADYDGSISTEHANARFLTPCLAKTGWALFMDGDMLVRADVAEVFEGLDESKAVYCVKHDYAPVEKTKMDGQVQTAYERKNWSSFCLFNCEHESNRCLGEIANNWPGRDLHRFDWLDDCEIGELGSEWNWLVRHSPPLDDPKVVHFTDGLPNMHGYEGDAYADEWRAELMRLAA